MGDGPDREQIAAMLAAAGEGKLPGHLGLEIVELTEAAAVMRCELQPFHSAPNGYLHGGSVISLADTCAGYGCMGNLPDGASGFTTIELKANFVGTLHEGAMVARASLVHGGRTTQLWDVVVSDESTGRTISVFRCTQLILYPR